MQWFRFWNDVLDDPKCHQMTDSTFKTMVQLMCFVSELEHDGCIKLPIAEVAWRLRVRPNNLEANLKHLEALGVISRDNNHITLINWGKRQFKSDNVSERVKRYRQRYSETLDETDQNRDRADTEKKIYKRKVPLPKNLELNKEMIEYATLKGIADINLQDIFEEFSIYHRKQGSKFIDWNAAWQTWIRKKIEFDKQSKEQDNWAHLPEARKGGLCVKCGKEVKYLGDLCSTCHYGREDGK